MKTSHQRAAALLICILFQACAQVPAESPIAILTGPDPVGYGIEFTLRGGASLSPEGAELVAYHWRNLDAPQVINLPIDTELKTSEASLQVHFPEGAPLLPGSYHFELRVQDADGRRSEPATVEVRVDAGTDPIAVLTGPVRVVLGDTFELDASQSITDAGPLRYQWTLLPEGTSTETTVPTLTVTAEEAGLMRFRLVVTDAFDRASSPREVLVAVAAYHEPTAILDAPPEVSSGAPLTLSAIRSSAASPGYLARYRWESISAHGVFANLEPGTPVETETPTFEVQPIPGAPVEGPTQFSLVVLDELGQASSPAAISVVFVTDVSRPTAVLDGPASAPRGSSFTLSGARSSDSPPGRVVLYRFSNVDCSNLAGWSVGQILETTEPTVEARPVSAEVYPPIGTCRFQLRVVDDSENEADLVELGVPIVAP